MSRCERVCRESTLRFAVPCSSGRCVVQNGVCVECLMTSFNSSIQEGREEMREVEEDKKAGVVEEVGERGRIHV